MNKINKKDILIYYLLVLPFYQSEFLLQLFLFHFYSERYFE